jgi:hypothetical protein
LGIVTIDSGVLAEVDNAFLDAPRPKTFTVEDGDPECMDHDALLHSRTRDTLTIQDVNRPGYDPLTECLPDGMAYFFPSLARFALVEPHDVWNWYGQLLLNHLRYGASGNRFYLHCTSRQRAAVAALLRHLIETRAALIEENLCVDDFASCLAWWRDAQPAAQPDAR